MKKIDPEYVPVNKKPFIVKKPYISHKFSLKINSEVIQNKRLILETISKDRNELIHHLHERFKFESIQNCHEAIKFIDLQREECLSYFDEIRNLVVCYAHCLKETVAIMSTEEFLNAVSNGS